MIAAGPAIVLLVSWPGHLIPPATMPSVQRCEDARTAILESATAYRGTAAMVRSGTFTVVCKSGGGNGAVIGAGAGPRGGVALAGFTSRGVQDPVQGRSMACVPRGSQPTHAS